MTSNLIRIWNKYIPYIRPCYSMSRATSPELINFLRNQRVPMICHNTKETALVNNASLTIIDRERTCKREDRRKFDVGQENIIYSMRQINKITGTGALVWIHTSVSNNARDETKQMFEYVWANKHILNGIVLDISNFSNPILIPSVYSYKIAIDYLFRNMIHPFQKEYGITTPSIMMDGRNIITRTDHLFELHEYALSRCQYLWGKSMVKPKVHLMVDRLFDSVVK